MHVVAFQTENVFLFDLSIWVFLLKSGSPQGPQEEAWQNVCLFVFKMLGFDIFFPAKVPLKQWVFESRCRSKTSQMICGLSIYFSLLLAMTASEVFSKNYCKFWVCGFSQSGLSYFFCNSQATLGLLDTEIAHEFWL